MIFNPDDGYEWYLRPGGTDMRRHSASLSVDAQVVMHQDPLSRSVFVFCNGSRTTLRMIVWDGNGFWELTKKLGTGRFRWPESSVDALKVTPEEIVLALKGGDPWRRLPRLHPLQVC